MVCCIAADLITNPTLTLKVSVGCVVSIQTFDFLGVHFCIFSWCAFCTGVYSDIGFFGCAFVHIFFVCILYGRYLS